MRFKKIILILCASILSVIVLNGVINWIVYTPKYLHLYGKVDPRVGLEARTVNLTDKKQCNDCCYYNIGTEEYDVLSKYKTTKITIKKDGSYSAKIPINLEKIKWGCRWDRKSIDIKFFFKGRESLSSSKIFFFEDNEFESYKKTYSFMTLLKKSLYILGSVEYRKDISSSKKNEELYEIAEFLDPSVSYKSYYYEIPPGTDVIECEMNITDIRFENTVETARKIEVD